MARLNEPPVPTESVDILKRRFIRQNRDIARANSTQSLRIRELEDETTRLQSENLNLRKRVIQFHRTGSKVCKQEFFVQLDEARYQLQRKMKEVGSLVDELGLLQVHTMSETDLDALLGLSTIIRTLPSSPAARRPRRSVVDQEGKLASIVEDQLCPRKTASEDEALDLITAASAVNSPDLPTPPIAHFETEERYERCESRCGSRDETPSDENLDGISSSAIARFDDRKRRRESANVFHFINDPAEAFGAANKGWRGAEQPEPSADGEKPLKSAARRKISVREDRDCNKSPDLTDETPSIISQHAGGDDPVAIEDAEDDLPTEKHVLRSSGRVARSELENNVPAKQDSKITPNSHKRKAVSPERPALGPKNANIDPVSPLKNHTSTTTTSKRSDSKSARDSESRPSKNTVTTDFKPSVLDRLEARAQKRAKDREEAEQKKSQEQEAKERKAREREEALAASRRERSRARESRGSSAATQKDAGPKRSSSSRRTRYSRSSAASPAASDDETTMASCSAVVGVLDTETGSRRGSRRSEYRNSKAYPSPPAVSDNDDDDDATTTTVACTRAAAERRQANSRSTDQQDRHRHRRPSRSGPPSPAASEDEHETATLLPNGTSVVENRKSTRRMDHCRSSQSHPSSPVGIEDGDVPTPSLVPNDTSTATNGESQGRSSRRRSFSDPSSRSTFETEDDKRHAKSSQKSKPRTSTSSSTSQREGGSEVVSTRSEAPDPSPHQVHIKEEEEEEEGEEEMQSWNMIRGNDRLSCPSPTPLNTRLLSASPTSNRAVKDSDSEAGSVISDALSLKNNDNRVSDSHSKNRSRSRNRSNSSASAHGNTSKIDPEPVVVAAPDSDLRSSIAGPPPTGEAESVFIGAEDVADEGERERTTEGGGGGGGGGGRSSRRSRSTATVNYAEPNLRAKMRRPTTGFVDAVTGEQKASKGRSSLSLSLATGSISNVASRSSGAEVRDLLAGVGVGGDGAADGGDDDAAALMDVEMSTAAASGGAAVSDGISAANGTTGSSTAPPAHAAVATTRHHRRHTTTTTTTTAAGEEGLHDADARQGHTHHTNHRRQLPLHH